MFLVIEKGVFKQLCLKSTFTTMVPGRGRNAKRSSKLFGKVHSVMVFNINYETQGGDLKYEFQEFGSVLDVHIPRDLKGSSKGFGFVRYVLFFSFLF